MAAWWYGDPGRGLGVIGVTGTDGKTTTAAMAVAALEAAGIRTGPGQHGRAEDRRGSGPARPPTSTTPEAPELQRALRAMVGAGDAAAVVESTSHGLALERVGEIPYDVAILTNLTHEHLELHGTFEAYRAAKRSLFERLAVGAGQPAEAGVAPGRPAMAARRDREPRRPERGRLRRRHACRRRDPADLRDRAAAPTCARPPIDETPGGIRRRGRDAPRRRRT